MGQLLVLKVLKELESGRKYTRKDLASKFEVSERKITDTIHIIRIAGYDVKSQTGPGGYYQLDSGSKNDYLVEYFYSNGKICDVKETKITSGNNPYSLDGLNKIQDYLKRKYNYDKVIITFVK